MARSAPIARSPGAAGHITQPAVEIQQAMTQARSQVNERPSGRNCRGAYQFDWRRLSQSGCGAAADTLPLRGIRRHPRPAPLRRSSSSSGVRSRIRTSCELSAYLTSYPNGQFKSIRLGADRRAGDGPSTTRATCRKPSIRDDLYDEATQETEDQIGLNKASVKNVQRRLTGLGFDTRANGKFDGTTRAVIARWQAARGYPKTGFLNTLQHNALLTETAPAARASSAQRRNAEALRPSSRRCSPSPRRRRSSWRDRGVGGLFGRSDRQIYAACCVAAA